MLTSLAEEMRARAAFEMQSKFVPLPPPRLAEHGDEDGGKREREREQARPIKWQIQAIVGGERRRERKSERREAARGKIR